MRHVLRIGTAGLLLGLCGCASDVWFKPGAGPDALARDKAACWAEADAEGDREASFERCMSERSWWHVAPGRGEDVALGEGDVIEAPGSEAEAVGLSPGGGTPDVAARPEAALTTAPGAPTGDGASAQGTQQAPERTTAGTPPTRTLRPRSRPIDPGKRQFWFKMGAGTDRLAADQQICRGELGFDPEADSPSRWGESAEFDACMRELGWLGGSVEAD